GWGRWCFAAARRGYVPIGIDPSLEAIAAGRRIARQLGVDAHFLVADARRLPFRDDAVDVAFSYSVFQHFAKANVQPALRALALAAASPVVALAALAIKLEDGGPVFYKQARVGRGGEEFELLKLRTMVVGAEKQGAGWAVDRGDPRITRVGRVLRRLSLDELPQLWNVLRGDMSLIGPRPTLAYQVERYTPRQRRRLEVRPGI